MRRATAAVLLSALLLAGCGGGDDEDTAEAAAPSPKPSPSADPKGDWLSAVAGLCNSMSGAVSGQQMQDGMDGKWTPGEILAGEKAARPAADAFDKGLAALNAPPEAAEADKALKDFLALMRPTVTELLAAAKAGDQAGVNAALAKREKLRLGPQGFASITPHGLPEKCNYRTAYS